MKFKPYILLWAAIPLGLIIVCFSDSGDFDIQMHDTYFAIDRHVALGSTIILFVLGLLHYLIGHNKLNNWVSLFHAICTTAFILGYLAISSMSNVYFDVNEKMWLLWAALLLALLFLVAQFGFFINLIVLLIRPRSMRK